MMRLNLIERYIALTIARATGLTLLAVILLLVVFGFVEKLEYVGTGDFRISHAFVVAVLTAPRYVFEVFPVAVLIGSLLGLGGMAARSELVAMRAAGVSLRDLLVAVLKTGLLLMLLVFLFGELVAPPSERLQQQYRAEKMHRQISMSSEYGFWLRDGNSFVNVRNILPGGRLTDLYIYEFDDQRQLRLASYAELAEYRDDQWLLRGIHQSQFSPGGGVDSRLLDQARWESLLRPGMLSVLVVRPNMLPVWGLYRYIQFMHDNGQSAAVYEVAFWSKIAMPFATLVMLFLGIPFVLGQQRSRGTGERIFVGILLGAGFYMLNRGMSYAAVAYDVSPMLTALLPALVFSVLAVWLLRRVR